MKVSLHTFNISSVYYKWEGTVLFSSDLQASLGAHGVCYSHDYCLNISVNSAVTIQLSFT